MLAMATLPVSRYATLKPTVKCTIAKLAVLTSVPPSRRTDIASLLRREPLLGADARLTQHTLMRSDALSATVNRGHRKRPNLEVLLRGTRACHDVHAQLRRERRVLLVLHEVDETVVHVIHAHDRRGSLRRLE